MHPSFQKTTAVGWTTRFLKVALVMMASLYIVVYCAVVFFRIQYPFELEWMEGGSVDHVRRILSGQDLYVSPSLQFVPFIYPPLYYFVSAAVSKIIGVGLMPLRLTSVGASLGCFFFIFLIVKRETGSMFSGILAVGLFAATFPLSGAWLDIARVDTLFLLFLLAASYVVKFRTSARSLALAGVLISFAFLTKQTALAISLPIMLYCISINLRRSIFLMGTVVVLIGTSTLLFNHIYNGWYNYYVFNLPRQHPIIRSIAFSFWTQDIIAPLTIAFTMSVFFIFLVLTSMEEHSLFYVFMAAGMFVGAWMSRLHSDGYNNVLLPAYAAIAILFGLATHKISQFIQSTFTDKRRLLEICVYFCCVIQFSILFYNPLSLIPTQADLEAGRKLIDKMAQVEGDVFVPYHGYLPVLAGKGSYAQGMALGDVIRGSGGQARDRLIDEIRQAIQEQRFGAIILDNSFFTWFINDIEKYYVKQGPVFDNGTVFWPVVGLRTRPEFIYIPKTQ
jgi:4-amino-4-deoxy-L-arabinose transferase-like glycosyltransferase